MDKGAREWIEQLGLRRHPEGGFFREIYRSEGAIPAGALPERYGSERSFSTAIYFLLPGDEISAFHRLQSDEWHRSPEPLFLRLDVILLQIFYFLIFFETSL